MSDWTFNGVARMLEMISSQSLTALFQVVMIDLVLAGDNAIVIGLAAAGLPEDKRKKAILAGILAATALRIGFAGITVQLLQMMGLLLAGGVLLLWVCWKMWRELQAHRQHEPNFHDLSAARVDHCRSPPVKRRSGRRYGRSRLRTCRCRSTMFWPLQARRANIRRS